MSNPARAPTETLSEAQAALSYLPDAFLSAEQSATFASAHSNAKDLEVIKARLAPLDLELWDSFEVPKSLTVVESVQMSSRPAQALAQRGPGKFRVRSAFGKALASVLYRGLWEGAPTPAWTSQVVGVRSREVVFFSGGAPLAMGRLALAYPKKGARVRLPVTAAEAARAVSECGLLMTELPEHVLRPYPILPAGSEESVRTNLHSDNGFPVLGKGDTEGAMARVLALVATMRVDLERGALSETGVWDQVRKWERERPYLVALLGKAKDDYYPIDKATTLRMRFYNVVPRQLMLLMQQGTQPFEHYSRSILQEQDNHSGLGITLTHGGAEKLVNRLDEQLLADGVAFVHVGDDSMLAIRVGEHIVLVSLDCSNFDLTQHADATLELHKALRAQLRLFSKVAGDLWYALMRERLVVTAGSLVYKWRHAGASGMPLQSKVNDMLMHVLIRRVLFEGGEAFATEGGAAERLQREGKGMGLEVRVDDYYKVQAETVREALTKQPFLFVGYHLYGQGGRIVCYADQPRTLAQMQYPRNNWFKANSDMFVMECMRLGSTLMNFGVPPLAMRESYDAARQYVDQRIGMVKDEILDAVDPSLRWAVGENPVGLPTPSSLRGLRAALARPPEQLWLDDPAELPGESTFVVLIPSPTSGGPKLSWADEVEQRERADTGALLRALGLQELVVPPAKRLGPVARLPPSAPPHTHPTNSKNAGRTPPTALWLPDKAPVPADELVSYRRAVERDAVVKLKKGKGRGMRGGEVVLGDE